MKLKFLLFFFLLSFSRVVHGQTVIDIIASSPNHNTLEVAILTAELDEVLSGEGPFTVFAPTDNAFAALPEGTVESLLQDPQGLLTDILLYHVVGDTILSSDLSDGQTIVTLNNGKTIKVNFKSEGVFINNALVSVADIETVNGIVHVIDAVLLPPTTVVDVISDSDNHNILEAVLDSAKMVIPLNGEGPFTVFAPTDDAFEALPQGTIEALLSDIPALTSILTYHVAGVYALSSDLADGLSLATLNGKDVTVTINADGIFINNAKVTFADIAADNGVVHVIDAVLLPPTETITVFDIITDSPDHNILEAAILAAGLDGALSGEGPFTVFAPTDDAFEALPQGTIEALLSDIPALTSILTYHVAGVHALSSDLADGLSLTTLNGKDVTVTINADGIFINNAKVTFADIAADNGVVHVIDAVLLPPTETNTVFDIIAGSPDHNILEAAILAAGLDGALSGEGPFTVFAPTDDAFEALPQGTIEALLSDIPALTSILTYHVAGVHALSSDLSDGLSLTTLNGKDVTVTINADGIFINNAKVTFADIAADNGVVHVIDAVLLPSTETNTVFDIIAGSPDHNILEAAILAAGLDGALSGEGPFTVFTPTDDAFEALPQGTIEALLSDIPALTSILTYHVVGVHALSSDLSDGLSLTTLNGKDVTVTINADGIFINNAKVTFADIAADNGVVHVIDAVLLPPTETITVFDIITDSPDHNILEAAILAAGLDGALSGEGPFTVFAPTDDAFEALPQGTIEALLSDPQGILTEILLYHVVEDTITSAGITEFAAEFPYLQTLNGKTLTLNVTQNGIFVNNAKIIITDLLADNGVVHVIDAVLIAPDSTIVDVVRNSPAHTILEQLLDIASFSAPLEGYGPFTLFAPTNAAIAALPQQLIDQLISDPEGQLSNILAYHLLGGNITSAELENGQSLETFLGKDINVQVTGEGIFINNAKVIFADILTDNGVVHVIDAVLLPKTTVMDIIDNSPDHFILSSTLRLAGLDGVLKGNGPFTVFAPTDEAFEALPEEIVNAVLADPDLLTSILTYHVAGLKALSSDLVNGQEIATVNGAKVKVSINSEGIFINEAKVTIADIVADNGVVHVIDAILLPPPSSTQESNDALNVSVFPNPSSDIITISGLETGDGKITLTIYEMKGTSVLNTTLFENGQVDISELNKGIYILKVQNGEKVSSRKLIKM